MAKEYKDTTKKMKAEATRIMNTSQFKKCSLAIHTASGISGAAGFVPISVADAIPISAAQITMVVTLGKVFNQKITESAAKGLIGAAASTFVGRSLVKLIPVVGWGVSAAVAAGVTEAIGWTIAVDFAKKAKLEWDNEHGDVTDEERVSQEVQTDSEAETEQEIIQKTIDDLEERAKPFLNGEKPKQGNETELNALKNDIGKIIDECDLPEDAPIRNTYDKLYDL